MRLHSLFQTLYMCKHIICVAFTMKTIVPTAEDKKKVTIGVKAKPGVKAKATPAFVRQSSD